ncbi:PAS domain-containing sensor histidine kinase [Nocardioides marinquilinus]|uniref:PAS domain-containing sensor histidine kinase n=1 Tax=Nocardioides marinquilinus TaxID=1210400 RepID=UPI0031E75D9F
MTSPHPGAADTARALRLATAKLRSLFDFHPDGVFTLDLEGRFTSVNAQGLAQSGGYREDELLGTSFQDLLGEDGRAVATGNFVALLQREARTFDIHFIRRDGSIGELEIIGLPIIVDDELTEILGIAEDITERKRFQRALAEARSAAESANDAKSMFLATMSHEIRTPLTSVLAAAELLETTELDDEQRQLVHVMGRSGERLLRLVNEILDFSRVEAGRADLVAIPFRLAPIVDPETIFLGTGAVEKGLACTSTLDATLPEQLVGDPERIAQVIGNLVGNAAKFTHEGSIAVRTSRGGLGVRFEVTDTGIGLPDGRHHHVFEAFQQGDSSITRQFGGTGLGLAISRQLVHLMGGTIEVDSTPGRGSTFTVELPLRAVTTP